MAGPINLRIWQSQQGGGSSGSAGSADVDAPADTSDVVSTGDSLSAKTFGAFTDPDGLINFYTASNVITSGSCAWTGAGLGPYTPSDTDGDTGVLLLQARDASNNILATAVHAYHRDDSYRVVSAPASTNQHVVSGGSFLNKTFLPFNDLDSQIASYEAEVLDSNGGTNWSDGGSNNTIGPYSASNETDGDAGVLLLHAKNSSNKILATAVHTYSRGYEEPDYVTAPADTTEFVLAGAELSDHTFGAFTDPDGAIDNYLRENINTTGTNSWDGTGLGPYLPSDNDGDFGVLLLHARDASNNVLATAVHTFGRGGQDPIVEPPASSANHVSSGGTLSAKTFSAFTDSDSKIDNYLVENVVGNGTATWTGSGLGPYTPTATDGDTGTLVLSARDASNNILATAVHAYSIGGGTGGTDFTSLELADVDITDGTWTLFDPLSLVSSVSYNSSTNKTTVTWNTASSNTVHLTSSTMNAPKWYKTLEIDSTAMTLNDYVTMFVQCEVDTTTATYSNQHSIIGLCQDPDTTSNNVAHVIACGVSENGGNGNATVIARTSSFANTQDGCLGSVEFGGMRGGGATGKPYDPVAQTFGNNMLQAKSGAAFTFADTDPMYLVVVAGGRSSSNMMSAGETSVFSFKYAVMKFNYGF